MPLQEGNPITATFTLQNTNPGTLRVNEVRVAVSGPGGDSIIAEGGIQLNVDVAAGASREFAVRKPSGLGAGNYSAWVEVDIPGARLTSRATPVTFRVWPKGQVISRPQGHSSFTPTWRRWNVTSAQGMGALLDNQGVNWAHIMTFDPATGQAQGWFKDPAKAILNVDFPIEAGRGYQLWLGAAAEFVVPATEPAPANLVIPWWDGWQLVGNPLRQDATADQVLVALRERQPWAAQVVHATNGELAFAWGDGPKVKFPVKADEAVWVIKWQHEQVTVWADHPRITYEGPWQEPWRQGDWRFRKTAWRPSAQPGVRRATLRFTGDWVRFTTVGWFGGDQHRVEEVLRGRGDTRDYGVAWCPGCSGQPDAFTWHTPDNIRIRIDGQDRGLASNFAPSWTELVYDFALPYGEHTITVEAVRPANADFLVELFNVMGDFAVEVVRFEYRGRP